MISRSKFHHYVPQALLRNFKSETGKLYYKNLVDDKPVKHRNTGRIFGEKYFNRLTFGDVDYQDSVENAHNMEFESRLDEILNKGILADVDKIHSHISITDEQIIKLKQFILSQTFRVPKARELYRDYIKEAMENAFVNYENKDDMTCEKLDAFKYLLESEDYHADCLKKMSLWDHPEHKPVMDMPLEVLCISDTTQYFIISDVAVLIFDNKILKGVEKCPDELSIFMPISNKCGVFISDIVTKDKTIVDISNKNKIDDINKGIFNGAREIAGCSKALVQSFV
jgi:hypothetical protein